MRFIVPSAAKLNLSLRVAGRLENNYHNIVSLFWRLPSVESLWISIAEREDEVRCRGIEVEGENIVSRALRYARNTGRKIPFLNVEIVKALYPGSGLGAGSGNAAAVLRWLAGDGYSFEWRKTALETGADVPFLFSGHSLALISGIGEVLEPLDPLPLINAWIVFPEWSVGTENAYGELDRRCGGVYPLDEAAARIEAEMLCHKLRHKEQIGFLPNDFTPGLIDKFPDYGKLFQVFEDEGSCAWGITGSGGAAFALFYDTSNSAIVTWPPWVRQVLSV